MPVFSDLTEFCHRLLWRCAVPLCGFGSCLLTSADGGSVLPAVQRVGGFRYWFVWLTKSSFSDLEEAFSSVS